MKKRIFIVEDETDLRNLLKLVLEQTGYEVETLSTAEALMIRRNTGLPHLYILDINLPGISGLDLCVHLKYQETTKDIPVILISANPEIASLAKQSGADGYISKPLNRESLLNKVSSILNARSENP